MYCLPFVSSEMTECMLSKKDHALDKQYKILRIIFDFQRIIQNAQVSIKAKYYIILLQNKTNTYS